MNQMLRAARDRDRGVGDFALGVRVGPGALFPRLSRIVQTKKKMEISGSRKPRRVLGSWSTTQRQSGGPIVRRSRSSQGKSRSVLEDQVRRGQVLKHTEEEAKLLYPGLVIAFLGTNMKERRATGRPQHVYCMMDPTESQSTGGPESDIQERCPMALGSQTWYEGKGVKRRKNVRIDS